MAVLAVAIGPGLLGVSRSARRWGSAAEGSRTRGLLVRHQAQQRRIHACGEGVDQACDEKGEAVVVLVSDEPPQHRGAAPGEARDALDRRPPPAQVRVYAIQDDGRVDRPHGIHEAPPEDVEEDHERQRLCLPQREERENAADLPREGGLAAAHLHGEVAADLHEDRDADRVACAQAVQSDRREAVIFLEEQGEELHGHARADGRHDAADLHHDGHRPLLAHAEHTLELPGILLPRLGRSGRGRGGASGIGLGPAFAATAGVRVGDEASLQVRVALGGGLLQQQKGRQHQRPHAEACDEEDVKKMHTPLVADKGDEPYLHQRPHRVAEQEERALDRHHLGEPALRHAIR
mmetsp:Transcript_67771/g.191836  ORF Transcript_67771/g.191836 Transcript_67771/m.191836 type:complete len:349 (+) Transcript_67771:516-1562(+)